MKTISSKSNEILVKIRQLSNKKYRKESGLFLLEGKRICEEAMLQNVDIIHTLIDEKSKMAENINSLKFQNIILLSTDLFASISSTVNSQGIICVCRQSSLEFGIPLGNSIILDRLQDPGNMGTILRTAAATNFLDIYLIDCVDVYNEKVIRSSMGSIFKLRIHKATCEILLTNKQQFDSTFLVADMNGENLFDFHLPKGKIAVIIGNEGNGIDDNILDLADNTLCIPMDNNIESLNAAISASVIMYQIRQREK